jgi:cytochrome c peroxidase
MKRALLAVLVVPLIVLWTYGCDGTNNPVEIETVEAGAEDSGPQFAKGGKKPGGGLPSGADIVDLGEAIFADENLSLHGNQSCKTCHEPDEGFAAPTSGVVTQGSVVQGSDGSFGDRKPPSAAYATLAPVFAYSGNNARGGNFWDGRATGEVLGNAAADQALGPFLNPKEQALPSSACVVYRVCTAGYATSFESVWGVGSCPSLPDNICEVSADPSPGERLQAQVDEAYHNIGLSIAAFEASDLVNAFSSRLDAGQLTPLEEEGEKLFASNGKCAQCHDDKGSPTLYTDFEFHNLGVPRNPANPVYGHGSSEFDPGLGGFTDKPAHLGKFKTPTVRNVGKGDNRTFMHNGSLVSLRQVVQFYNTRDVLPVCAPSEMDAESDRARWGPDGEYRCWPPPEFPQNLDTKRMGNLGLTDHQVDAIVAYMEALNDR